MEKHSKQKNEKTNIIRFDTLESLSKRYGIVLKAGFRDRDRILRAAEKMDRLRGRYGMSDKKISSVESIRKWRDKR